MKNLSNLLDDANHRSQEEQERHAEIYNARPREPKSEVGDQLWKRNRVLSSAAQGVMAKLAPKYVGPYEIVEKKGLNTYSLMNQKGSVEDLIHAEHLKPYFDGKEPEEEDNTDGIRRNQRGPARSVRSAASGC